MPGSKVVLGSTASFLPAEEQYALQGQLADWRNRSVAAASAGPSEGPVPHSTHPDQHKHPASIMATIVHRLPNSSFNPS